MSWESKAVDEIILNEEIEKAYEETVKILTALREEFYSGYSEMSISDTLSEAEEALEQFRRENCEITNTTNT